MTAHYVECNDVEPNSITLAVAKLVGDQLRTCVEPASVMEFGFYQSCYRVTASYHQQLGSTVNSAGQLNTLTDKMLRYIITQYCR